MQHGRQDGDVQAHPDEEAESEEDETPADEARGVPPQDRGRQGQHMLPALFLQCFLYCIADPPRLTAVCLGEVQIFQLSIECGKSIAYPAVKGVYISGHRSAKIESLSVLLKVAVFGPLLKMRSTNRWYT